MSIKKHIFIRLVYGFAGDNTSSIIEMPCRRAILCLLTIHQFSNDSIISQIPKEIILIIAKQLWDFRQSFVAPLNVFYRPMYNKDYIGEPYYGFDYGHVVNIFKESQAISAGTYQLSSAEVPIEIVNLYSKYFHGIEMKRYALLQNVYTSHYASGYVMYGYYFVDDMSIGIEKDHEEIEVDGITLSVIICIAHTANYYENFIGIEMGKFQGTESDEEAEHNAMIIHNKYIPPIIPSRERILDCLNKNSMRVTDNQLDLFPMMSFVPTMCYCCT